MPGGEVRSYLEISSPQNSWRVELDHEALCRIGRANQNTVVLAGDMISRYHAVIQCTEDGEYLVADLGSRNGTLVNGTRVNAPVALSDNDRIAIGEHVLIFHQESRVPRATEDAFEETKMRISVRKISVMVVDIFDFTGLLSLEPVRVAEAMVAFNRETGTLLKDQRAWAQKYSGDGLMALWVHDEGDAKTDGLQRMVMRSIIGVADLASQLQRRFALPLPVRIGAGIDSGYAMLGNIGSDARSDHTALGDAVNRAFRLEAATREFQCDIALSGDAYQNWRETLPDLDFRPEYASLKGFPGESLVYTGSFDSLRKFMDHENR